LTIISLNCCSSLAVDKYLDRILEARTLDRTQQ
jgi:hypothetical protein